MGQIIRAVGQESKVTRATSGHRAGAQRSKIVKVRLSKHANGSAAATAAATAACLHISAPGFHRCPAWQISGKDGIRLALVDLPVRRGVILSGISATADTLIGIDHVEHGITNNGRIQD